MKKYSLLFKEAVKRSKNLGLNKGESFRRYQQNYSDPQLLNSAIKRYKSLGWGINELSQNCGLAHAEIFHLLEHHDERAYITIGNVHINGKPWLNVSPESLISDLKKGPCEDVMNMHVWLTLPNMTIHDFTIRPNQAMNAGIALDIEKSIITLKPDEFDPEHYYEPMIVGHQFLQKIGCYDISA